MGAYDPEVSPVPTDWLRTDEGDRIQLVVAYHGRKNIQLPDAQLHAVVHVVVENQLALGDKVVVDTLARLQAEGLSRHDALHAIGSILAEKLYELMRDDEGATGQSYGRYLERLHTLTARSWRDS
jgi:hypothetical protein